MKKILTLALIFVCMTTFSQKSDEDQIKATLEKFFEGFHKGDIPLMRATLHEKLIMQTVYKDREGKDVLTQDDPEHFLDAIAKRPPEEKWDERLLDIIIKIDGKMANVWTPYEFRFNNVLIHCGVNSLHMFKDNGTWKIIYMIDTRRREGCR
ncbi:MAG: nuclear transport factor 2 family protein [Bacteroidota bacterium]